MDSDKAVMIMIFMYCVSFMVFAVQYLVADVIHVTIVSPVTGEPFVTALANSTNIAKINEVMQNFINIDFNNVVTAIPAASSVVWEIFQLMLGVYFFNLLYLIGLPAIVVVPMIFVYLVLLFLFILGRLPVIGRN